MEAPAEGAASRAQHREAGDAHSGITLAGGNPHVEVHPTRYSVTAAEQHCELSKVTQQSRPSVRTPCSSSPRFFPLASLCDSVTLLGHQAGSTESTKKQLIGEGSQGSSTLREVRSRFKPSSITHKP